MPDGVLWSRGYRGYSTTQQDKCTDTPLCASHYEDARRRGARSLFASRAQRSVESLSAPYDIYAIHVPTFLMRPEFRGVLDDARIAELNKSIGTFKPLGPQQPQGQQHLRRPTSRTHSNPSVGDSLGAGRVHSSPTWHQF